MKTGTGFVLVLSALVLGACASDQRRLVRLQNEHAYLASSEAEECGKPAPAYNCNVAADALDLARKHRELAIESSGRACNGKTADACATHGMFPDALKLLKRDSKAIRKAGVK